MNKEEVLAKMLPIVGMTSLRVYIQLVEQYLTAYVKCDPDGEVWFRPDVKFITLEENMSESRFYSILNNLVVLGFVEKKFIGKKLKWRISFDMLDSVL